MEKITKLTKLTNRVAAQLVFNYMEKEGFIPYNIEHGNGYFIFEMGEDSVVWFNVKGHNFRKWKFAMWICTDKEYIEKSKENNPDGKKLPAIQFFCQHDLNMDKFKPSRCQLLESYTYQELNTIINNIDDIDDNGYLLWWFYRIGNMLNMIKRHPFIAFGMDSCDNYYFNGSYIRKYLSTSWSVNKYRFNEWRKDFTTKVWHGSKVWFLNQYTVVNNVELIDCDTDDYKSYPRYEMRIHFNKMSDDEEGQKELEVHMLNKWFKKPNYNNMSFLITREGLVNNEGELIFYDYEWGD